MLHGIGDALQAGELAVNQRLHAGLALAQRAVKLAQQLDFPRRRVDRLRCLLLLQGVAVVQHLELTGQRGGLTIEQRQLLGRIAHLSGFIQHARNRFERRPDAGVNAGVGAATGVDVAPLAAIAVAQFAEPGGRLGIAATCCGERLLKRLPGAGQLVKRIEAGQIIHRHAAHAVA